MPLGKNATAGDYVKDFRKSNYFIRLNTLSDHCKKRRLNNNLEWLE